MATNVSLEYQIHYKDLDNLKTNISNVESYFMDLINIVYKNYEYTKKLANKTNQIIPSDIAKSQKKADKGYLYINEWKDQVSINLKNVEDKFCDLFARINEIQVVPKSPLYKKAEMVHYEKGNKTDKRNLVFNFDEDKKSKSRDQELDQVSYKKT